MSTHEYGQKQLATQQEEEEVEGVDGEIGEAEAEAEEHHTPPRFTNEASNNNNNSIMGKVKLRVSSIFPDSLSKWFSPSASNTGETAAAAALAEQQPPHNGSAVTSQNKRKRGRRRIQLEADDAAYLMDDGIDAQDLNEEEVRLADNIAEHDLAAEDEQLRRSEYNVSLLRKRQLAAARDPNDDDDDDDDDEDVEEEEEGDDDAEDTEALNYRPTQQQQQQQHLQQQLNQQQQQPINPSDASFRMSKLKKSSQPLQKRQKRLEQAETTLSPQFSLTRRRPQLHASTPAASDPLRSHAPPNRLTYLNLYGHQRQREPAYNFLLTGSMSEAAVATSGDLPMTSRRSLNIAPMTERRETGLPSYRRGSLHNWNRCSPISELPLPYEQQQTQDKQTTIIRQETNNNNNIINAKRGGIGGGDSHSECESNESHVGGMHNNNNKSTNNNNNNGNLIFYSNLQSRKSIFNSNAATPAHHNSTLSLNSLNQRRRFNASIYGSTSALSDSRLLSSSISGLSGSPFYQGPTAFGGNAANNRYFSQGNLGIINSGSSSPAPSNSDSGSVKVNNSYGMKPVEMRPKTTDGIGGNTTPGLSQTAQRILNLLENHSTPLMDARKMGSTLREHQQQRSNRNSSKPYAYPSYNNSSNNNRLNAQTEQDSNPNLLVPTMLQLLEQRRMQRVAITPRHIIEAKQLEQQQKEEQRLQKLQQQREQQQQKQKQQEQQQQQQSVAVGSSSTGSLSHTNKMRSRLTHQTRKESRNVADEDLPPPPVELPQIRFPQMASEPKFDLVISPPPKPTTTIGAAVAAKTTVASETAVATQFVATNTAATATPATSHNNNNLTFASAPHNQQSQSIINNYQFAAPIQLHYNNMANNCLPVALKRVRHTFIFAEPTPLDRQQQQQQQPQQPRLLPSSAFNGASNNYNNNSSSSSSNNTLKSGSVLDVLLPSKQQQPTGIATPAPVALGFGDQFKKSASEWECDACMVRNKQDASECIACGTHKPKPKETARGAATAPVPIATISSGFGDRFKPAANNWECDACMLSNKAEASKCIACETPRARKVAPPTAAASNSNSSSSNSSSSNSTSSSNSLPFVPDPAVGFGNAFKPKANTWECNTCMIMNESSCTECVACQTPNPKSSAVANSSKTAVSSFKFGFSAGTPTPTPAPKPDAGFQKLIAAQKSTTWNCEACMAQNDVSRTKCICCEQLKPGANADALITSAVPKFMFGFVNSTAAKSTDVAPVAAATTAAAPIVPAAAPAPAQFNFGFATAGKDVADKPTVASATTFGTPATTFGTSATTGFKFGGTDTPATTGFKFGGTDTTPATTGFKFGGADTPATKAVSFKLSTDMQQQQQSQPAEAADKTAPASIMAPAASSLGLGFFAPPSSASATAISSGTTTTFAFGISSSNRSVTTATTTTASNNQLFSFGGFTNNSLTVSSSSSSSSTNTNSSNSGSNNIKPAITTFSFGNSSSSSSSNSQTIPTITEPISAPNTTAAAPLLSFAQRQPPVTVVSGSSEPTFLFGNTAAVPAAPTTTSNNFLFGTPAASTSMNQQITDSIFGSLKKGNNNTTTTSSNYTAIVSSNVTPNMFSFGNTNTNSKNNMNSSPSNYSPYTFGSKPMASVAATVAGVPTSSSSTSTTTTTLKSFGWPTASSTASVALNPFAATAMPIFGSGSAITTTTNATQPLAVSSPFSLTAAGTPTTQQQQQQTSGGGAAATTGGLSSVFGNVNNPFGGSSIKNVAAAPPTTLVNLFNSSNNNTATTVVTSAIPAAKPAFNFGSTAIAAPPSTPGIFNFGAAPSNNGAAAANSGGNGVVPKPAFNFTASAAAPQSAAFNFSANTPTATTNTGGNSTDVLYRGTQPVFQFGAGDGASSAANAPATETAAVNQFNFMQSTPNAAAPFQFNAGAPAPANIFAFNPPNAGNTMQNVRRKIRGPMRRLPPR